MADRTAENGVVLALDTASPRVSVAVARGDRVLAQREGAQRESSARLVGWIDDVLGEAGLALGDLAGAVAASGPGSFTGLRVGLATLLGFHQAIELAVAGLPTLSLLAAAAPGGKRVAALVPAAPGEWFAQAFDSTWPPTALGEPKRLSAAELADWGRQAATAEAAGVELLAVATAEEAARLADAAWRVHVAGPLAPVAARLASLHPPAWNASSLSRPLYLAPPPVTVPGAPKPVLPVGEASRR